MVQDPATNCTMTLEILRGKKKGETSKETKIETIVLKTSLVTRHSRDSIGLPGVSLLRGVSCLCLSSLFHRSARINLASKSTCEPNDMQALVS